MNVDIEKTSSSQSTLTESKRTSSESTSVGELLAFAGTGIASALSMWANIREAFYQKMRRDVFKSLYEDRTEKISALGNKLVNNNITVEQFNLEISDVKKSSQALWDNGLKKMGINNLIDRFGHLNKFEQAKTVAIGLTVFSVGMGAIIALRSRFSAENRIKHVENVQQQLQNTPSR